MELKKIKYININDLDTVRNDTYIIRACTCNNVIRVLRKKGGSVTVCEHIDVIDDNDVSFHSKLIVYGFELIKC